jgi:outer membrane immunogenic protein
MKKLFLSGVSATACVLAMVSVASATDLAVPARPYYKAPPPPLLFNWTGCYIGAHIGAGWDTKTKWNELDNAFDNIRAPRTMLIFSSNCSLVRRDRDFGT